MGRAVIMIIYLHLPVRGPRKFEGESDVAAILQSSMEVNYCTSGFFHR